LWSSRPAGIGGPFCCSDGQQGDGRQAGQRGIEDGTRGDLRFHATAGARGNGSTLPSYGSSLVRFLQPHPFFFFFTLPSRCRRSGTMQAALLRRERTSRQRRGYDTNPPYRTHCPCPVETRGLEGVEGRRERYEPGDGPTRLHFPCRDAIIFTWALTPTCRVSRGGSQGSCQYVRYEYFTWYGIPTRCSRLHVSVFLLH
jgi:hypothetical protein